MNARLGLLAIAVASMSVGCRSADSPTTVSPAADNLRPTPIADESDDDDGDDDDHVESSNGDEFTVTLASRCRDTWKATLVPGTGRNGEARPTGTGWEPGGFEVRPKSNHDLSMRRGDSLLLTNTSGGIMMLSFDNLSAGYGARVEVTQECSGVSKTVVRAP